MTYLILMAFLVGFALGMIASRIIERRRRRAQERIDRAKSYTMLPIARALYTNLSPLRNRTPFKSGGETFKAEYRPRPSQLTSDFHRVEHGRFPIKVDTEATFLVENGKIVHLDDEGA